jgi:hypothetical protein
MLFTTPLEQEALADRHEPMVRLGIGDGMSLTSTAEHLPGCGECATASGPFTYERYAADVGADVDALDEFLTGPFAGGSQDWRDAFATKSSNHFADAFADDVVLEGSALNQPIEGRERVKAVMATASGIYDSLVFTREASNGSSTYVEWEATAFGGIMLEGVTILTRNGHGRIVSARIHHRPLGAVLRFSAELRERLRGVIAPSHFYGGSDAPR